MKHDFSDEYLVIAGRRSDLTGSDRLRLAQMNDDLNCIRVITYDVLIDALVKRLHGQWRGGIGGVAE
jgi:hypothetical protein